MSYPLQHNLITSFRLVTAPTTTGIVCAEDLRSYCNTFDPAFDADLAQYQRDAIEYIETVTGRQLITATWKLILDRFPAVIELRKPPIQSVDSITYIDEDGVEQTLNASLYQVDSDNEPGRIVPAYDQSWPATRCQPQAVQVEFTAGYGGRDEIPEGIKTAIKWYVKGEFRRCDMLADVDRMLGRFQWREISA